MKKTQEFHIGKKLRFLIATNVETTFGSDFFVTKQEPKGSQLKVAVRGFSGITVQVFGAMVHRTCKLEISSPTSHAPG